MTFSSKRYRQTLIKKKLIFGVFLGYKQETIYDTLLREQDRLYFR